MERDRKTNSENQIIREIILSDYAACKEKGRRGRMKEKWGSG